MSGEDWALCRNRLIERGITEFTDADIVTEFVALTAERESLISHGEIKSVPDLRL